MVLTRTIKTQTGNLDEKKKSNYVMHTRDAPHSWKHSLTNIQRMEKHISCYGILEATKRR